METRYPETEDEDQIFETAAKFHPVDRHECLGKVIPSPQNSESPTREIPQCSCRWANAINTEVETVAERVKNAEIKEKEGVAKRAEAAR